MAERDWLTLPEWTLRDLQAPVNERRTGARTVYYRDGKVISVEIGAERLTPPRLPIDSTEVPCPHCKAPALVIDNGRRAFCAPCRRTWTDLEVLTKGSAPCPA